MNKIQNNDKQEASSDNFTKTQDEKLGNSTKKENSGIAWILYDKRFLAVISLVIAVLLWIFVAVYQDPITDETIHNISVELDMNSPVFTQYQITPVNWENPKISVNVRGDRLDLTQLTDKDFKATVSLDHVSVPGTYNLPVEVTTDLTNITIDARSMKPNIVSVEFEKLSKKEVELKAKFNEITIPENHILGEAIISPKKLSIVAAETLIDKIDHVEVELEDVPSELADTYITKGEIVLYDAAGEKLSKDDYQMEKNVATVTIPVNVLKEIPVDVQFINMPDGFPIEDLGYEISQEKIWVSGPRKTIDSIETIEIGPIDFNEMNTSYVGHFPIELRDNCEDVEKVQEITFTLDSDKLDSIKLNTSDIRLANVPKGYNIKSDFSSINNITIIGKSEVIEELSGTDFYARVDFSDRNVQDGKWTMPVKIIFPRGKEAWAYGEYTIVVTVTSEESK